MFCRWDRIGGSYRKPSAEQLNQKLRHSDETRLKEAKAIEELMKKDPDMRDTSAKYLVPDSKVMGHGKEE